MSNRNIVVFFTTKKFHKEPYSTLNRLGEWLDAMLENEDIEQVSVLRGDKKP